MSHLKNDLVAEVITVSFNAGIIFLPQSPPGRPWGLRLPECYSPISLQSHQEEVGPKVRAMGNWGPGAVPGRITTLPPVGKIAKRYTI